MLDKIKNIFFVEEEGGAKKPKEQKSTNKDQKTKVAGGTGAQAPSQGGAAETNYTPPTSGKPDEKFVNMLLGALEKNNLQGFDYLEYKQSLQNLGNVQMDEETKFKSALAMAKTMGATPELLVSSANHYIKVLTTEENKFLQAFKNQQTAQVQSRNSEIEKLKKLIDDKTKRIEQLKKEIELDKKNLEAKKTSINQAAAKVASTKDRFYLAFNIVVNQIKEDLTKIQKYLT